MKSLLKKVKRRKLNKGLKRQLATESIFAMGRFRQTGQSPTQEDSPLLMCIWARARDHILEGNATVVFNVHGVGMGLRVTAIELRDDQNKPSKFTVYDAGVGSLLLVGDMSGPVFPVPKGAAQAPPLKNQLKKRASHHETHYSRPPGQARVPRTRGQYVHAP